MDNRVAALGNEIRRVGEPSIVRVTESKKNFTGASADAGTGKRFSQFLYRVSNRAETLFVNPIKESVCKFFRTINWKVCRVFSGYFGSARHASTSNAEKKSSASAPVNDTAQAEPAAKEYPIFIKVTGETLLEKFKQPEKMAKHILSTFFTDGGACPDAYSAITWLKTNTRDQCFSSEKIHYLSDGIRLTEGTPGGGKTGPVDVLFDERKVGENKYVCDFMRKTPFSSAFDLAEKLLQDKHVMTKWTNAEINKFRVHMDKGDHQGYSKEYVDSYLQTCYPDVMAHAYPQKPALPVKGPLVQQAGQEVLAQRAAMASSPGVSPRPFDVASSSAAGDISPGTVAKHRPLIEAALANNNFAKRQAS